MAEKTGTLAEDLGSGEPRTKGVALHRADSISACRGSSISLKPARRYYPHRLFRSTLLDKKFHFEVLVQLSYRSRRPPIVRDFAHNAKDATSRTMRKKRVKRISTFTADITSTKVLAFSDESTGACPRRTTSDLSAYLARFKIVINSPAQTGAPPLDEAARPTRLLSSRRND
jgi:hypothetical protein